MLKKFLCLIVLLFLFADVVSAEGGGKKRTCYDKQEDQVSNRRTSQRHLIGDSDEHFPKNEKVSGSVTFEDFADFMEEFSRIIRESFPFLTFLNLP